MDRDPVSHSRNAGDTAGLGEPHPVPRKFGRLPARSAAQTGVARPAALVLPAPSDPSRRVSPIESVAPSGDSQLNVAAATATSEGTSASLPLASVATPDSLLGAAPAEATIELSPPAIAPGSALPIDTPPAPMAASLESPAPDIAPARAPESPMVASALHSAEPAPAYDPPPLALPATLEPNRAAPQSRHRPVGRAVKWLCAAAAMFVLGLAGARAVAAFTTGLPPCESETAASLVAAIARERAAELKLPFATLAVVDAQTVARNDGAAQCAGAIHIDGQAALRIRYEISWTHRLLARYQVRITETAPQ